jgi:phosphoglycolate phosphatase
VSSGSSVRSKLNRPRNRYTIPAYLALLSTASADYDYYLFDLDGRLVDVTWSYTRKVFDHVGDRLGCRFTDEGARTIWHGSSRPRAAILREMGVDPEAFWPEFHDVEDPQPRAESTYLHDDAERFVGDVKGPVSLIAHCYEFLTDPVLDHLDVRDRFHIAVCCTDDVG